MGILESIFWLLVLIGVMILVHELGHFWAARYFDVRVETFSFGFGPRLFGFRRGETDYRLSAILFGGYVKMAGEQPGDEGVNDPRGFLAKRRWQRLIIAFAGPFMNVVLAVVLLTGLYMYKFPKPPDERHAGLIGHVMPDTPAARAGLREGDRIVQIGDIDGPSWEQIVLKELESANRTLTVIVDRAGQRIQTSVTPAMNERTGLGFAGWAEQTDILIGSLSAGLPAAKAGLKVGDQILSINDYPIRSSYTLHQVIRASGGKPIEVEYLRHGRRAKLTVKPVFSSIDGPQRWMIGVAPEPRRVYISLPPAAAFRESLKQNADSAALIYRFLRGIVERRMSPKSIEGPIGIARVSSAMAREGPSAFFNWMAAVSLNLAVINLLPIPVLDGGVILMLLVEMFIRRDLSLKVKEAVFKLGFAFLLALMVFVLYNDITKMLPG